MKKIGWSGRGWDTWERNERASYAGRPGAETPRLKVTLTFGTGLGKKNLELTRNLSPCLLVSIVPGSAGREKKPVLFPSAGAQRRTDLPDKTPHWFNNGTMVMGLTNYFLFYYRVCSIERISYLLRMNYLIDSIVTVYLSHVKIYYVYSN